MYQVPRILIEIDNDQFTKPSKKIPSHELPFYLERYGPSINIKEKLSDTYDIDIITVCQIRRYEIYTSMISYCIHVYF